ncbi:PREDICTED: uncharacterized protein LOC105562791 [Vollenhovia emeryi]|uniref:uncharacterized protein LOC105562791 n=1 Tax=Vollenhovia emeryi TaxID=411798 RepID=UPI0005F44B67|nr:PREDICTED: uncharacterized protein LOC105562791 [Vollenhovia emeryi]
MAVLYSKLERYARRCNSCHKFVDSSRYEIHLHRTHKIFHEKEIVRRIGLVYRYFVEEGDVLKCKICNKLLVKASRECVLEIHLIRCHPSVIEEIHKEFKSMWVWPHFDTSKYQTSCKMCHKMFNIFKVNLVPQHLLNNHGINERIQESTGRNNVITTIKQSTEENSAGTAVKPVYSQVKEIQKIENGKCYEYCILFSSSRIFTYMQQSRKKLDIYLS